MMKFAAGFVLAFLLSCGASPTDEVFQAGTNAGMALVAATPAQVPPNAARGAPVQGDGTPGVVPVWTGARSLGDAPIKIDSDGNVILRPGASLFLVTEDGTKCIQINGAFMTFPYKAGLPCPTW